MALGIQIKSVFKILAKSPSTKVGGIFNSSQFAKLYLHALYYIKTLGPVSPFNIPEKIGQAPVGQCWDLCLVPLVN